MLRSIGRKSINDFTSEEIDKAGKWAYKFWQQLGTKSPFFRRWFGDWREADTSKVEVMPEIKTIDAKDKDEAVAYIKAKVKDGTFFRGNKANNDTKFSINIGMQVYDDTITYANRQYSRSKDFDNYLAQVSILAKASDIVKKSILLDTEVIEDESNPDRSFIHKFYNTATIAGKNYLITLLVDEFNTEKGDIYRAYNVDDIKITPVAGSRVYKPSLTTGAKGSVASSYTVADLHALVKQYDKDFKPLPPVHHDSKKSLALTAFIVIATLFVTLYAPVRMRSLVLPSCITIASGLFAMAVCRCLIKEMSWSRIPIWCYSPIFLFILVLVPFFPVSPFAKNVTFSMEYESGASFSFIQKSALAVEASLLELNTFDRLILHIEQGRATFTIIGGRKRDILQIIHNLSTYYPDIFFYIPEKHTRHAIDVTVYGNDVPEIENNVLQLAEYVNKNANNVNIIYNFKSDATNIVLEIPVKCVSAGLYPYDVYKTLYYTASEPVVDKYFADGVETDVKIRGESVYRKTLSGLLAVPVLSPFGSAGEAGDYINIRRESAQKRIYHRNRMRSLSFSVTGLGRAELRRLVASFPFTGNCHGELL